LLPLPTRIVIGISNFLAGWGGIATLATSIAAAVGVRTYYKTKQGRWNIDTIILKLPVFGGLVRKIAVARFSRILSTLLSSGVPILQSLDITAKTAGNVIIEDAIIKVRVGVERGENFVDPLKATEAFPHMVGQMIGVGEQTGALDAMLGKIADFYEDEVDTAIADILSMIEPMLILFLGVTIGSIVVAMYLPLFTLIGKLASGGK
jgi:type IV pilus assembly protein PilC